MKYSIVFLFLLTSLTVVFAQEVTVDTTAVEDYLEESNEEGEDISHVLVKPEDLSKTKQYKEEKVQVRKFDKATWKKVTGEKNFEEKAPEKKEEEKTNEEDSSAHTPSTPWNLSWLPYVGYGIIVALAGLIIYYVVKNTSFDRNKISKPVARENNFAENIDNIEELEIQSLLQQTLAAGNYRLALRMYFLDLLKALHEQGKIAWKKDKTNRDYLGEIFTKSFYFSEIRKLTLAYEMVWYGEHTLPTESFRQLFTEFESIQLKLKDASTK